MGVRRPRAPARRVDVLPLRRHQVAVIGGGRRDADPLRGADLWRSVASLPHLGTPALFPTRAHTIAMRPLGRTVACSVSALALGPAGPRPPASLGLGCSSRLQVAVGDPVRNSARHDKSSLDGGMVAKTRRKCPFSENLKHI